MKLGTVFLPFATTAILFGLCNANDIVQTPNGPLQYDEDWGYVTVRKNAHTFWWLMSAGYEIPIRPLILWLQGGPGSASTGFGNFKEFGPKYMNLKDRNSTWLQVADLVFVDNPVGTGFSYVDSPKAFTTNVKQIGADLVAWAKAFYKQFPEYEERDFYIFSESYGGKMAAEFGKQLQDAIDAGKIKAKLSGVALGDSWISGMDFINTWPEYLYATSNLDGKQLLEAQAQASECQNLVDWGRWKEATGCFFKMERLIGELTNGGVCMYNIIGNCEIYDKKNLKVDKNRKLLGFKEKKTQYPHSAIFQGDDLDDFMNTKMRKKFGSTIPENVTFVSQNFDVFDKQAGDFMKPNIAAVDNLLKRGVKVSIFNGQLDLICDTLGVEAWLKKLKWQHRDNFFNAEKNTFGSKDGNEVWGYHKKYENLEFFYILRAGHMAPIDVPFPALDVVKQIIGPN